MNDHPATSVVVPLAAAEVLVAVDEPDEPVDGVVVVAEPEDDPGKH